MSKIIALQSTNQSLALLLQEHGYQVIDMYEAHRQHSSIAAYLYTTYHPDAFTSHYSLAESVDNILGNIDESSYFRNTLMLNISNLEPEQILMILERRFYQ